jgi:hypothetical protein
MSERAKPNDSNKDSSHHERAEAVEASVKAWRVSSVGKADQRGKP